jgi:hypothetical protein
MMRRARHLLATAPQSCCDEQVAAKVLYCPSIERRTVRNFFKVRPQPPAASQPLAPQPPWPPAPRVRPEMHAWAQQQTSTNTGKHQPGLIRDILGPPMSSAPSPALAQPCCLRHQHRVCMCAGGGPPQARGAPQHCGAAWRSVLATHPCCLLCGCGGRSWDSSSSS